MTLTKEWLLKTIAELEEERDAVPGAVNEDAAMALAAMKLALASLEAEAMTQVLSSRAGNDTSTIDKALPEGTMLYTAPPAPVAMKDHQIRDLVNELRDIAVEYYGTQQLRERIAKTVRAAMLQGVENAETPTTMQTAPALDSSPKIAELPTGINQGKSEPVTTANKLPAIGWLRADYQDDNRGLRGNAPLFVLGKKDPSTVWGLDYIPLTSNSPVIQDGWRLVPEEPTHEMLEAGDEPFGTYDVYRRMIAAAPQQK